MKGILIRGVIYFELYSVLYEHRRDIRISNSRNKLEFHSETNHDFISKDFKMLDSIHNQKD